MKEYDQAFSLVPTHIDTLLGKGKTLLAMGNYDDAIKYTDKALAILPHLENIL